MRWLLPASETWCYVAAVAAGGVFLVVAALALFRDRAKGRRRCPRCWYDLAGVEGLKCPECGRTARSERALRKTRGRWGWVAAALPLAVYALAAGATPDVRMYGWAYRLPDAVLVRLYPWADRPNGAKRIGSENRPVLQAILMHAQRAGGIGSAARRVLAARAVDELDSTDDMYRRRDAYLVLFATREESRPYLERLLRHAQNEALPVPGQHARVVIAEVGAEEPEVQAYLLTLLGTLPSAESELFVPRLPVRGPGAVAYVPELARMVGAGGYGAHTAARRLLSIGPPAREAIPALEAAARAEPNPDIRIIFTGAIDCIEGRYADDAAFYALLLTAEDGDWRNLGANMLGSMEVGDRAAPYLDAVVKAYQSILPDDPPSMAMHCLRAIGARGEEARHVLPLLRARLDDPACPAYERNEIGMAIRRIRGGL